jgi:hypothetical protein
MTDFAPSLEQGAVDSKAVTMAVVAGRNARTLRRGANVNLQHFAKALRPYGLEWSSGGLSYFESGRGAPTLPILLAVAGALTDVCEQPVTVSDLFAGTGQVQINDGSTSLSAVRAALAGKPFTEVKLSAATTINWESLPDWARKIDPTLLARVRHDFLESDERMCKRIGVELDIGAALMAQLWQQTFTAQRDVLAGPHANQQHRGQIARQLQRQLAAELQAADDEA